MKKNILSIGIVLSFVFSANSQTNTFPASAHVGIGTATPLRKLHVAGGLMINSLSTASSGEIDTLHFGKDHTTGSGSLYSLGEIRSFTSNGYAGGLNFYTGRSLGAGAYGSVHAMTLTEEGVLGLGTTSAAPISTNYGTFALNGSSGSGINLKVGGSNVSYWYHDGSGDVFNNVSNTQSRFFTNGTLAMTLSASQNALFPGNVGIGTTSPAQKLDVNGAVQISAGPGLVLANSSSAYYGVSTVYSYITRSDGSGGSFPWNAGGTTVFQAESLSGTGGFAFATGTTPSVKMAILANGKIGIGTSSPAEKLSVEGNIYANGNVSSNGIVTTKKLIVTQLGWSDYVFDKKYKLRSLASLESFIRQNKHLPEVPSAKEVEEKGISVGDNQALLLKKIEELTLYIIELEKKSNQQQIQINSLKNKK